MNQTDWQELITTPLKVTKPYWFVQTQNGTRVYETVNRDQAVKYAKSNSIGHIILSVHESKGVN